MAHAYTPGLKVTDSFLVRKRRILPLEGDVIVKAGQQTDPNDVVARTELPGDAVLENVASRLGLPPEEVPGCMLKKEGDHVEKDEVIAKAKSFFGLFKSVAKASRPGTIESINKITGQVLLRGAPLPVEVKAYLKGQVVEVEPRQGCVIETWATFIQGIFGIGGETNGILKMVCTSPDEPLTPDKISGDHAGCIIIGGSIVTAAALQEAIKKNVRGIVVGGFNDQDLRNFLGYDLGVAITGSENKGITLVVTEGFGEIPMTDRTFNLLRQFEGKKACCHGATQIRAGVIRPEVVIPMAESDLHKDMEVTAGALQIGTPIRVIREPYFGRIGKVSDLPPAPAPLESETRARVLKLVFDDDGKEAMVPRANVEILET